MECVGSGGGQVVNDPSLNPADSYSFSVKIVFEKNKNKAAHLKKTEWSVT